MAKENTNTALSVDVQAGNFLQKFGKSLEQYAIRKYNKDTFLKSAMLAIVSSQELTNCLKTEEGKLSIFSALRYAATVGVSLNPAEGKAALIAYDGKVTYQIMKGGMIELALDSGKIEHLSADYVRKNDTFSIKKTSNGDQYEFTPALQERGDVIGFYAALKFKNGTTHVKWMTKDEVEYVRNNYSSLYRAKPEKSPWTKSFLGMGVKTVIKALLRSLSISNELDTAIGADDFFDAEFSVESGPVTATEAAEKLKDDKPKMETKPDKQESLL